METLYRKKANALIKYKYNHPHKLRLVSMGHCRHTWGADDPWQHWNGDKGGLRAQVPPGHANYTKKVHVRSWARHHLPPSDTYKPRMQQKTFCWELQWTMNLKIIFIGILVYNLRVFNLQATSIPFAISPNVAWIKSKWNFSQLMRKNWMVCFS